MRASDSATAFLIDRDSITHGSAYERHIMRPYDTEALGKHAMILRSRDPRGDNHIVIGKRPNLKGQDPEQAVNELLRHLNEPMKNRTFTLEIEPDEGLQDRVAREYNIRSPDVPLEPEHVLAGARDSFFKPEQAWTRTPYKHFGPFGVYTIEKDGKDLAVAVPLSIRLSNLEAAMIAKGSLQAHFEPGSFGGLDALLTGKFKRAERTDRTSGEKYRTSQIRDVQEPVLEHRDGRLFTSTPLNYAAGTVKPVRYQG